MIKINSIIHAFSIVIFLLLSQCSLNDSDLVVPESGYDWPDNSRQYWPTEDWQLASMEEHDIDPDKMAIANQFAENDPLARALVVVKDGYIVYENYYGDGGIDESTNLWSVTKSFASALTFQ